MRSAQLRDGAVSLLIQLTPLFDSTIENAVVSGYPHPGAAGALPPRPGLRGLRREDQEGEDHQLCEVRMGFPKKLGMDLAT